MSKSGSNSGIANVILLSDEDNVVVACEDIRAGARILVDGEEIEVSADVGLGHKIARKHIDPSEKILKYGAPIGRATESVPCGGHVHIHNMTSDYLHSHTERQATGDET